MIACRKRSIFLKVEKKNHLAFVCFHSYSDNVTFIFIVDCKNSYSLSIFQRYNAISSSTPYLISRKIFNLKNFISFSLLHGTASISILIKFLKNHKNSIKHKNIFFFFKLCFQLLRIFFLNHFY